MQPRVYARLHKGPTSVFVGFVRTHSGSLEVHLGILSRYPRSGTKDNAAILFKTPFPLDLSSRCERRDTSIRRRFLSQSGLQRVEIHMRKKCDTGAFEKFPFRISSVLPLNETCSLIVKIINSFKFACSLYIIEYRSETALHRYVITREQCFICRFNVN